MWIYILAIYFVIQNGGTSSPQGTFQAAFDGCYGIQGWSLVTEDNVRNSFKSGSSWTDSRLYQSKTFNLSIVVEKRLKIQSASALCEEGDRSSIEYYLSSTRTCRNKTHLSTLNMDQLNDLIKRRSIHSGSNYIIGNFNISDRPMFNFLCGFWRNETKEFVWENCSLIRPFICFVGFPKYTILRASYSSKDPPWRNNDSGRHPASETGKNLYLSSTHICRNNSHLKTIIMDQVKDLINGGIIRSGANYIIDSFNETDWNNSDFLCGFWRNESKEFLWENCSLSRPFVCYVGLPKYTVLQAFYTSEDAHWTNNDSLSRQTSETVDLPIYTIQRASYTSMDLTFRKYDSSRHSASEKVSSGIWSATEARPSRTVSLTYTSVLHVQNTSKEANNTTHHDQKSIIIAAVTSGICLAALTISVIVVCKRKYRQKSRAPENEYTCLTTRSQPLEQVYEDLGRGNHEEEPEPLNHDNRSFIDEESEGKFSLTKAFPENTDSMVEETYDVIHE